MNGGIAWFFLYHRVDDLLPPGEAKTMACSVLDAGMVSLPQGSFGFLEEFGSIVRIRGGAVWLEQSMEVAQVSA